MQTQVIKIDLFKLIKYILKRIWLVILCAAIGFGAMYYWVAYHQRDIFAASGTMYVYNGNPNVVNYQYVSSNDLNSAVQLLDTYMVVVKSNKVMDSVAERLAPDYPGISAEYIRRTLSMGSVADTGVMSVTCRTNIPQLSADICNAILDVAPAEIIRVVSAGSVEVIDYAVVPEEPEPRGEMRKGILGGMAGAVLAGGLLVLLFLLNRKITEAKDLENSFTPPILASVNRTRKESGKPSDYLLNGSSPMEKLESYAKLRMNMLFTLVNKKNHVVVVTSAISGEGKSTVTANLAVSCAMGGRRVLLVDADLRRACQADIFEYDRKTHGLTEVLIGARHWDECLLKTWMENLDILPAGQLPPNPAELLSSSGMTKVLEEINEAYDLVLIDVPPINIVSDPLVLSDRVAGCLFVTRQGYSDINDIRSALISAEMTGMDVLGFVFCGEKLTETKYYHKKYYSRYDNRYFAQAERPMEKQPEQNGEQ